MRLPPALALILLLPLAGAAAQETFPSAGGTGTAQPAGAPATPAPAGTAQAGAAQTGAAQPAAAADTKTIPKDAEKEWTIGFSVLTAEGLSTENAYLVYSIPLLIRDGLSGLPTHSFSDDSRRSVAASVIRAELRGVSQTLAQLRKDRDEAFFTPGTGTLAADSAAQRLKTSLDRQAFLLSLDPAAVDVAAEKPVVIRGGKGAGDLLDTPRWSPQAFAADQGVDLLIGGSAAEVQGYIVLDLWAWDAVRQEYVWHFRDAARREGMYADLGEASDGLTGIVLGRPWASVTIVPDPPGSTTTVDGKFVGAGRIASVPLLPGTRELSFSAPGYTDKSVTLELAPEEKRTVTVTLEREGRPTVAVASQPPGADVYADSLWMGKTPLLLDVPPVRERLELVSPGFYGTSLSVGPGAPPSISITLLPDTGSREDAQKKARDAFYTSFGFFVVSLPFPFFFYSFTLDEATEILRLQASVGNTLAAQQSAYITGNIWYYSYLAGTGISASLFVWMVINLVNYVTAATRTAG
jgi:hypothetical protein